MVLNAKKKVFFCVEEILHIFPYMLFLVIQRLQQLLNIVLVIFIIIKPLPTYSWNIHEQFSRKQVEQ